MAEFEQKVRALLQLFNEGEIGTLELLDSIEEEIESARAHLLGARYRKSSSLKAVWSDYLEAYVLEDVGGDEAAVREAAQYEADRLGTPVYYRQHPDAEYVLVTPRQEEV